MNSNVEKMHARREAGDCPFCGHTVKTNEFRDFKSRDEFKISGLCQKCQDDFFKGE